MNFQMLEFIIMFIVVFLLYWIIRKAKFQNALILLSSYVFVCYANIWFGVILAVATLLNYIVGIFVEKGSKNRKAIFIIGVLLNLILLGSFKYFGFFVENVNYVLSLVGLSTIETSLKIIIPLGISFFTFTNIGYIADVYKGEIKAEKNVLTFFTFIGYFPKILSGPIERAKDLIPQLNAERSINISIISEALTRIIWGYFKKLVIADNLGITVSKIFILESPSLPVLILGVITFAFQLYADFSAYTDIAIGVSKLLGIKLTENFNFPYTSRSPAEFWKRWHISLSNWIKDYIYIPLGGSRKGTSRTYINLLIAFTLSGLWHGSSWNYILWGFYWGLLLIVQRILDPITSKIKKGWLNDLFSVSFTFFLVNIGWLMFYETDINYLIKYVHLIGYSTSPFEWQMSAYIFLTNLVFILPLGIYYLYDKFTKKVIKEHDLLRFVLQHVINAILIILIILLSTNVKGDFIYQAF